ncbi:MAG: ATP phosphoribosyltransferase regulatory subunit [Clostridia bacterium]|nr:ATP phosphoribosyltransferase regulatory subunit [Clostridia bacterium]
MTNQINNGDSVTQSLGKLFRKYGYSRYKMSKFEEYDTYVENKDFLISDRVITFTDVSGKLLAMKPDVTISIIKNTDDTDGQIHKMYYKENVYRVSKGTHAFKEIMQMGLECIGDIDSYSICEVVSIAAQSLKTISSDFILDISHMGLVSAILSEADFTSVETSKTLNAIGEKNLPELLSICDEKGLPKELTERIASLINLCGPCTQVVKNLNTICTSEECKKALVELKVLCDVLEKSDISQNVQIDFSVVNDMNYYNGIVFRGYIEGIPTGVLSGGQYDKLMTKMQKKSKALGFALYLDLLEMLNNGTKEYDTDVLIIYDDKTAPVEVFSKTQEYLNQGRQVLALKSVPVNFRYKELADLAKGGK